MTQREKGSALPERMQEYFKIKKMMSRTISLIYYKPFSIFTGP